MKRYEVKIDPVVGLPFRISESASQLHNITIEDRTHILHYTPHLYVPIWGLVLYNVDHLQPQILKLRGHVSLETYERDTATYYSPA